LARQLWQRWCTGTPRCRTAGRRRAVIVIIEVRIEIGIEIGGRRCTATGCCTTRTTAISGQYAIQKTRTGHPYHLGYNSIHYRVDFLDREISERSTENMWF